MSCFPPYGHNKNEMKIELDLSSYATKYDLQQVSIQFAKKMNQLTENQMLMKQISTN